MNKPKKDRSVIRDATITFFVNKAEKERIEKAAQKRGMTLSMLGRMIINEYLEERGE